MNAKTGRRPIGPKVAANLPKEDIVRLDQIAEESEVQRADVIRDGLRWYLDAALGPLPASPELAQQMADLQACAWDKPNAALPRGVRNQDAREVAKAISEANAIAEIHTNGDEEWNLDLDNVWRTILANQDEGLTELWARVLLQYAALVREQEGGDFLLVQVDIVQWTLTLSVGGFPWSAIPEATYTWRLGRKHYADWSITVLESSVTTNKKEPVDRWGAASRMVLREHLEEIPAHEGPAAEETLGEVSTLPEQMIPVLVSEWREARRQKAGERLGLKSHKGKEAEEMIDAELVRMNQQEREEREEFLAQERERRRVPRRREDGSAPKPAPKPVEEEPLAEWEIQLLKDSEAKAVDDE